MALTEQGYHLKMLNCANSKQPSKDKIKTVCLVSCDKWSINACLMCLGLVNYQYVYSSVAEYGKLWHGLLRSYFVYSHKPQRHTFHCEAAWPSLNNELHDFKMVLALLPLPQQSN